MNIRPVEGDILYRSWKLESPSCFIRDHASDAYPFRVVFLYPKEHYEEPVLVQKSHMCP